MQEIIKMMDELKRFHQAVPDNDGIQELQILQRLLVEQRAPRLGLVGRSGSGKSSLTNAIFGRKLDPPLGNSQAYAIDLGTLEFVDLQKPENTNAVEPPDIVLFLVNATEVESAIKPDLQTLVDLRTVIGPMAIVGIVTHADALEPKEVKLPQTRRDTPPDVRQKVHRVGQVIGLMQHEICARPELLADYLTVYGVSSRMVWNADKSLAVDERWKIDQLLAYLVGQLPDQAQVAFGRVSGAQNVRSETARRLTSLTEGLTIPIVRADAKATAPINEAENAPHTVLQLLLVLAIAELSGQTLSTKDAAEFLSAIGKDIAAASAARTAARSLEQQMPELGAMVSSTAAAVVIGGVGNAAIAHFIDGKPIHEAKSVFVASFQP